MPNSLRRLYKNTNLQLKRTPTRHESGNLESEIQSRNFVSESLKNPEHCTVLRGFPANADTFYGLRVLKSLLFYSPIILGIKMLIRLELSSSLFHFFSDIG